MTTVQQTIDRVIRSYLLTNQREQRNRLTTTVDDNDTALTFDFDLDGIKPNTRIAIGLEDMHVWTVNETSKTASSVERGDGGTTATAHTAGDRVWVSPRFSPYDIFVQINAELADLSSPVNGLYQRKTTDLTMLSNVLAYNLPTDLVDVIGVYYSTDSFSEAWYRLRSGWRFQSGLPTSEFASGMALTLPGFSTSYSVRVVYKAAFTPVTTLTNDLTTFAGLPSTAQDIVEMGVALRIAAPKAIQRSFTGGQGDTRRAEEVSTSDVLQAPGRLAQLRQSRIAAEAARLKQQNGV